MLQQGKAYQRISEPSNISSPDPHEQIDKRFLSQDL